ncbi:hypothetical protein SAMN05660284_02293 [Formivibrio citricus]|uniref:Uncharacterized protein n=1 Tax=Formivibrio citricus TaxID=83765 RepID=A0A1I5BYI2_9NEIS|nr:hypothetical protein [Formivibrio citricus]SFN79682.1 hypothetical protein SAMN05660284_02293 [Formivibrio citricus]
MEMIELKEVTATIKNDKFGPHIRLNFSTGAEEDDQEYGLDLTFVMLGRLHIDYENESLDNVHCDNDFLAWQLESFTGYKYYFSEDFWVGKNREGIKSAIKGLKEKAGL